MAGRQQGAAAAQATASQLQQATPNERPIRRTLRLSQRQRFSSQVGFARQHGPQRGLAARPGVVPGGRQRFEKGGLRWRAGCAGSIGRQAAGHAAAIPAACRLQQARPRPASSPGTPAAWPPLSWWPPHPAGAAAQSPTPPAPAPPVGVRVGWLEPSWAGGGRLGRGRRQRPACGRSAASISIRGRAQCAALDGHARNRQHWEAPTCGRSLAFSCFTTPPAMALRNGSTGTPASTSACTAA